MNADALGLGLGRGFQGAHAATVLRTVREQQNHAASGGAVGQPSHAGHQTRPDGCAIVPCINIELMQDPQQPAMIRREWAQGHGMRTEEHKRKAIIRALCNEGFQQPPGGVPATFFAIIQSLHGTGTIQHHREIHHRRRAAHGPPPFGPRRRQHQQRKNDGRQQVRAPAREFRRGLGIGNSPAVHGAEGKPESRHEKQQQVGMAQLHHGWPPNERFRSIRGGKAGVARPKRAASRLSTQVAQGSSD